MITQPPRIRALLALAAFAIACVGLTIYLWLSFGGAVPLSPSGYRMYVAFPNAASLADQADVRISGVDVGKVVSTRLDTSTDRTVAAIDIFPQYAPRPVDTRAILRQKSALGEVYVELSPGNPRGRMLPDGGTLPAGGVEKNVPFSDLLSTFDPATRRALGTWLTQQGRALSNGGRALNDALFELTPLTAHAGALLAVVHDEQAAANAVIADGGEVMSALSAQPGELSALVGNTATVFAGLSARDAELARTVQRLPGFLTATDTTLRAVAGFARGSTASVVQLQPVARALGPVLTRARTIAPPLRALMVAIGPLARSSGAATAAFDRLLRSLDPLLARAQPYLGGVVPILHYLGLYRREIAGFVANASAATEATLPGDQAGPPLHYLRASVPINPESLAAYPYRLSSTRSNPYLAPDTALSLLHGLPVFGSYLCASHPDPTLSPLIGPPALHQQLQSAFFTTSPGGPPCRSQSLLGAATTGLQRAFPQLQALP